MELEIRDHEGNLITTIEVFDDVFHRWELEAASKGTSVEEHIVNILTKHLKKMTEELDNEQD